MVFIAWISYNRKTTLAYFNLMLVTYSSSKLIHSYFLPRSVKAIESSWNSN